MPGGFPKGPPRSPARSSSTSSPRKGASAGSSLANLKWLSFNFLAPLPALAGLFHTRVPDAACSCANSRSTNALLICSAVLRGSDACVLGLAMSMLPALPLVLSLTPPTRLSLAVVAAVVPAVPTVPAELEVLEVLNVLALPEVPVGLNPNSRASCALAATAA